MGPGLKILITGPPGSGKTTLARRISKLTGIRHIDVTQYIKDNSLYSSYLAELDTLEFDDEAVAARLADEISQEESTIVDTHTPSVGTGIQFDMILHLRCTADELAARLEERGYSERKIEENVQCLHFDVIGEELEECYGEQEVICVCTGKEPEEEDITDEEALERVVGLWEKHARTASGSGK